MQPNLLQTQAKLLELVLLGARALLTKLEVLLLLVHLPLLLKPDKALLHKHNPQPILQLQRIMEFLNRAQCLAVQEMAK